MEKNNLNPEIDNTNSNNINPVFEFEKYGIDVEEIKDEKLDIQLQGKKVNETMGLFSVKTANSWIEQAKLRPIPNMLFSELWYESEISILFSDTNIGKSILAVQIAECISSGKKINGFKFEAKKQKVLYFDFELTDKQFEHRYSIEYNHHYVFDDNFIRIEIDQNVEIPDGVNFEDFLNESLEEAIVKTGAKVLIVDNITYLKNETERAKDALPLMKHLKRLKNKYGLSIIALAHTPKRDLSKPITRNDLQGSKMLINFCDSAFAIGESSVDKSLRYIKQIKQRQTEQIYDSDNVCVCKIVKPNNFLMFEFVEFGTEREHLRQISELEKSSLEKDIINLLQLEPILTSYAIAKKLCNDEATFNSFKVKVNRIVNKIKNNENK